MSQTPITVKIDTQVKLEAQKLAQKLGLSLSAIIENKLREVVRDRRVVFEEEYIPNEKTAKELAKAEDDIKHNRNVSGPFSTYAEVEEYLLSLGHGD